MSRKLSPYYAKLNKLLFEVLDMNSPLLKLAGIGSGGILTAPLLSEGAGLEEWGCHGAALREWLRQNVFPIGRKDGVMDLETWNLPGTWRDTYQDMANGHLFFAEDVFGDQFCLKQGGIGR